MTSVPGLAAGRAGGGTGSPAAAPALPLTLAQSALWRRPGPPPGSPARALADVTVIDGPLDPPLFAAALRRAVSEADALRVRIAPGADGLRQAPMADWRRAARADGSPPPGDGPEGRPRPPAGSRGGPPSGASRPPGGRDGWRCVDLRAEPDPEAAAEAWQAAWLAEPFDVARGPLFGHALLRTADRRWHWCQRAHHAVTDGIGRSLLAARAAAVYSALVRGRHPGPSPFTPLRELVAADIAYRASPEYTADLAYWRRALEGVSRRPRGVPRRPRGGPGRSVALRRATSLSATAADRLRQTARSLGVGWPDLVIATEALYAARTDGVEEVVLGLSLPARTGHTRHSPGRTARVLPLRLSVTPATTLAQLAREVVRRGSEARRHQLCHPEDIRRAVRWPDGAPLVGTVVRVLPSGAGPSFAAASARVRNLSRGPVEDLALGVYDHVDGEPLRIELDGDAELHGEEALEARLARFAALLEAVAACDPHAPLAALPMLTPRERPWVLLEFNDTAHLVPPTTAIGPTESLAVRTPEAVALVDGATTLTYGELHARANRLARHLRGQGVRAGTTVAVALPLSPVWVVSLLAVLKAGAAFTPFPARGCAHVLADDGRWEEVRALGLPSTDPRSVELSAYPAIVPPRPLTPHHPALLLREPPGAPGGGADLIIPHGALDQRIRQWQRERPLRAGERVALAAPTARPHRPADEPNSVDGKARWGAAASDQGRVATGGPALDDRRGLVARTWGAGGPAGPQTSGHLEEILLTLKALRAGACLVLGAPAAALPEADGRAPLDGPWGPPWNTRLYILDAALQPCPPGVVGDVYVAGDRLASGYARRAALTALRFVADPYGPPGGRMHRTGERARWTGDGAVQRVRTAERLVGDSGEH
ncbi:condensation domain-containing protein [Streptomyces sp. LX-29]|uniref:condensation domain-containing protein n=1 Tax=Streptomyces sp. LX-29 TaxID=2900152 RepID=UPI00240CF62F|nr:condensation domain-containing protein [Streptomyces sp. LX-29]WFB06243.1 condensation domain-containing protein [Streptomyces sp. LX-29]